MFLLTMAGCVTLEMSLQESLFHWLAVNSFIAGRFMTPVANKSRYTMIPSPSANCLYRLTPGEPRRFTGRQDLLSGLYHKRGQSVQGAARELCVVNGPDRVLSEGESGAW